MKTLIRFPAGLAGATEVGNVPTDFRRAFAPPWPEPPWTRRWSHD